MDAHISTPTLAARATPPPKATGASAADQLLKLAQDPFRSQFVANSIWSALGTSVALTLTLALLFCLLRPRVSTVYAPKVKHGDPKTSPPALGRGFFAWIAPLRKKSEQDLIEAIGLDAIVFLRFTRMCRNLFLAMSVIGCAVLIPTNVAGSLSTKSLKGLSPFTLMTPLNAPPRSLWAQVVCSWLFNAMVAFALWWNYRAVTRLRRQYFESREYQMRLHGRTLMVTEIPRAHRHDNGLYKISNEAMPSAAIPRCAIGRDVAGLTELIEDHDKTVRKLESILAKYLKDPHRLPPNRPTLKAPNDDHGYVANTQVDAIQYLTDRIRSLEYQVKEARQNIEKRDPMPYGFVSYGSIPEAHAIAYAARKQHPQGTDIQLAPRPEDLIWKNLKLTKAQRRWKKFVNTLWVALLTVVWIVPNGLMAIFLTSLSNLGLFWPAFQTQLYAHPIWWAAVQGVAAPAITNLLYILLPIFFRRRGIKAGDVSKASRERHVIHHLYAFFVFNNLVVFTAFSTVAQFISLIIDSQTKGENIWKAVLRAHLGTQLATALCNISPFWVTWLLQRNYGAAIDLAQLWNLIWIWFAKTFMNPTPRQRHEWTRPPPFDYASYYNYFLFYATATLCFATLQPLVLPVTAIYFTLDCVMKKYLLMYVFVTKNESGGQFWRVLFNRLIFAVILADVAVTLVAWTREYNTYYMVFSMVPLPILMLAFKAYCRWTFDDDIHFYCKLPVHDAERLGAEHRHSERREKLGTRFGNPALYKPLITPLVLDEAKDVLTQIYRGRLGTDEGLTSSGYSDMQMDAMSRDAPGKPSADRQATLPFDFVSAANLDRPGFGDDYETGGLYGRPIDLITERSDTPKSFFGHGSVASQSRATSPTGTLRHPLGQQPSIYSSPLGSPTGRTDPHGGTTYPTQYHYPSPYGQHERRSSSPMSRTPGGYFPTYATQPHAVESETNLLQGAAPLSSSRNASYGSGYGAAWRTPSAGSGGAGYGQVPQQEDISSYEEYRRGRR